MAKVPPTRAQALDTRTGLSHAVIARRLGATVYHVQVGDAARGVADRPGSISVRR
jgi:hypothetical protein